MTDIVLTTTDLAADLVRNEGSVIVMTGTDAETGERVTFAGDHRMMIGAIEIVQGNGHLTVEVEGWQILGRHPADPDAPVEWAGRTFGELSPDEKRRAGRLAGAQLSAELTAAAPAISAVMDSTLPPWVREHGAEYDVPDEITSALPDVSWHNDACPCFGSQANDTDYCLWVEHPDPAKRELDGARFSVTTSNGEFTVYNGDDMQAALAAYREVTA